MKNGDQYRPQFHFTPPANWMNDPNGLCFYDDEYHLFYQHNPFENKFGHLSWGHAVSRDLVHWEHLPVAITEEDDIMIFSGSIVIDHNNTSGLGKGDIPPFIAIFTGNRCADGRQFQCLAYSNDRGRSWCKYKNNPVLDVQSGEFRDPKVLYFEPENIWIMIVATGLENRLLFFSSPNLIEWQHIGNFSYPEFKRIKWECPDMFRLPVNNGTDGYKWVLFVSKLSDDIATDTCSTYFVGDFNGKEFILDQEFTLQLENRKELKLDFGRDFYAASTWSNINNELGNAVCIAWMNNWKYAEVLPTRGWNGAMTIPRRLFLRHTEAGYSIVQKPLRELEKLRSSESSLKMKSIAEVNQFLINHQISSCELLLDADYNSGGLFSLELLNDKGRELIVKYDDTKKIFSIDRSMSNKIVPDIAFYQLQEIKYDACGKLKLNVFIDHSSIEIFLNDGETVLSSLFLPSSSNNMIRMSDSSMETTIKYFKVWKINSISIE